MMSIAIYTLTVGMYAAITLAAGSGVISLSAAAVSGGLVWFVGIAAGIVMVVNRIIAIIRFVSTKNALEMKDPNIRNAIKSQAEKIKQEAEDVVKRSK
jgi:hypothetical protein